jgi:tetratricopeptide (TPR) repeat protein
MSYINDALRKMQKEKGPDYASCSDTIFDEAQRPAARPSLTPFAAGAGIVLLVVAVSAAWWWLDAGKTQTPSAVQVPPVVSEQPVSVTDAQPQAEQFAGGTQTEIPADTVPEAQPGLPAAKEVLAQAPEQEKKAAPVTSVEKKQQVKSTPVDIKVIYERALKAHREGRLATAAGLYRKVIKADPLHVSAWNNLGVVRMNEKKYGMAAGNFHEALKIQGDYADAHYNLACLYARKSDKKQSLHYLKKAIGANPEARRWALQDRDFENLAGLTEFRQLTGAEDN